MYNFRMLIRLRYQKTIGKLIIYFILFILIKFINFIFLIISERIILLIKIKVPRINALP